MISIFWPCAKLFFPILVHFCLARLKERANSYGPKLLRFVWVRVVSCLYGVQTGYQHVEPTLFRSRLVNFHVVSQRKKFIGTLHFCFIQG
ncbi:hypothetical protein L211DRAFT_837448 [Terfezia boudieri ATCC MYA-4762]|uniref:Secreted protein n=1 Tax=Terfezia boudieri ATCC MYA-4762 TaxID=1051890 RepID=A0A3N4LNZ4_9PEZI|nr:hypothetical protein L211DRAFT_837448 [Terfezia boudieri ATCC MYA-4762]